MDRNLVALRIKDVATRLRKSVSGHDVIDALQPLIGKRVLAVVSQKDIAFSMALDARVIATEDAGSDQMATVHFGSSCFLTVPFDGTTAHSGSSGRSGTGMRWVEMQLPEGLTVVIEERPLESCPEIT